LESPRNFLVLMLCFFNVVPGYALLVCPALVLFFCFTSGTGGDWWRAESIANGGGGLYSAAYQLLTIILWQAATLLRLPRAL